MTANVLLIWIPVLSGLLVATITLFLFNRRFINLGHVRSWIYSFLISACCLSFGAFVGLLASIQINRIAFDYKVLSEALGPNGILVWYGFGPAFTPQFTGYWQYTTLLLMIALPVLLFSRTHFVSRFSQRHID